MRPSFPHPLLAKSGHVEVPAVVDTFDTIGEQRRTDTRTHTTQKVSTEVNITISKCALFRRINGPKNGPTLSNATVGHHQQQTVTTVDRGVKWSHTLTDRATSRIARPPCVES